MTTQEFWIILGMVVVTFGVRYPVLALVGRTELPPSLLDALKFIPPAVLTAIIVPAVLMPQGAIALTYTNAYLVAGLAAALIAWRSGNLLLTIGLGMGIFWLWRLLLGML
jgi:branched-subunit amino acid transport protein